MKNSEWLVFKDKSFDKGWLRGRYGCTATAEEQQLMWDKQDKEDDEAEKEAAEIAKRIALCEAQANVPRHGPITTAVHTSEVRPIVQVTVVQDPPLQPAIDRTAIELQSNIALGHKRSGLDEDLVSQDASSNPIVKEARSTIFYKTQYSSLMLEKQRASELIRIQQRNLNNWKRQ